MVVVALEVCPVERDHNLLPRAHDEAGPRRRQLRGRDGRGSRRGTCAHFGHRVPDDEGALAFALRRLIEDVRLIATWHVYFAQRNPIA